MKTLKISSDAFESGGYIPSRYTCEGVNVNPSLQIMGIPDLTKSLAIIVDDPDAPVGNWVHWVVWNIPVTNLIIEHNVPGKEGMNDFGNRHYGGPCPPKGMHRYFFKVFALDNELQLTSTSAKQDLENAMKTHVLASGELMGIYEKH
jgi:Raf kinase inhibitor-like YbhB/YbcL family protein